VGFDPDYVSQVLRENFEDAKAQFLSPLLSIHHAHLVMLTECGIVDRAAARRVRAALDGIAPDAVRCATYDGRCEDLFFYVERLIAEASDESSAALLRIARSRNDIDMTMYRMRQREYLGSAHEAAVALRDALLDLAARHVHTIFAAHTHTQPAQPTTVAHYLLAMVESLERDAARLRAAYATTNRSPLGACAITGTGFPIDRQTTSDLLGFDGPTGNTYGSIAAVDYLLESAAALIVLLTGIGRFVQDLLLWCTAEVGYLRLGDGFVQTSSIMPQKRNPVALEHTRALASKALGQCMAVVLPVHNTPFGDIVDIEDDLQPLAATAFRDANRALCLLAAALRGCELDTGRLEARAAQGGTTLTELADHLVRQHGIAFVAAHAIAGRLMATLRTSEGYDFVRAAPARPERAERAEGGLGTRDSAAAALSEVEGPGVGTRSSNPIEEALASAAREVIGRSLELPAGELRRVLGARHFVEVRTTSGGPAPRETSRALAEARAAVQRDREWLRLTRDQVASARERLQARSQGL
jgi:argininosuccinate lyase